MSLDDLDPVIHAPKRLAALALVVNSTEVDFSFLRQHLGISDSDLSKQMSALEKAGYIKVAKASRGRGGATWYRATSPGKAAFRRHMAALNALAGAAAPTPAPATEPTPG
jgi:DNA-binding transcriptional ArsR family regulator